MRKYRNRHLFGPGPSTVHPDVLGAMARPLLGHLDPEFLAISDEVRAMLRTAFGTANEVTFPVSGTGSAGMEAALLNVLSPGDVAVVGIAGLFGERMAEVARRAGAQVREVRTEWGTPLDPASIRETTTGAKVVAFVHAETSTGVWQPVEEIATNAREAGALVLLDTVTSLGGVPVEVDAWGIDVCYSGTQKCLSAPPGLAPITFSARALEARPEPVRSWYLDVGLLTRYWGQERAYHHTAPVSMIFALHEALRLALDEGMDERIARHERLGGVLEKELISLGFEYLAPEPCRLPQLHAVHPPAGVDATAFKNALLERFDIEIGGGVRPLAGKIIRIGLMGESCHEDRLDFLLEAIRETLASA